MNLKALALLSLISLIAAQDVISLEDDTFAEALETYPVMMVKFYATWCGHCKKMAPEYIKAAKLAHAQDLPFVFAEVDAPENKETQSKYGVSGFPTIKVFINGTAQDYEGGREAKDFVDYMKVITTSPLRLTTAEEILKEIEENEVAAFFFAEKESKEQKIGDELAKVLFDDAKFFMVEKAELLSAVEETGDLPKIVIMKKFDEKKNVFAGDKITKNKIKTFIQEKSVPMIRPLDQKTIQAMFQKNYPLMIYFRTESAIDKDQSANFRKLGEENKKGKMYFSEADNMDGFGKRVAEFVGLKENDVPIICVIQPKSGGLNKYRMDKKEYDLDYEGMNKFFTDFKNDKIEVYIKSQPIPETQGPVFTLVGKNYEKEVLKSGRDVMVKFYAPWCGHCKKVPHYIYIYIYI